MLKRMIWTLLNSARIWMVKHHLPGRWINPITLMQFEKTADVRVYHSRKCRLNHLTVERAANQGPEIGILHKDWLSDEAFVVLVSAILAQAAEDVIRLSPQSAVRIEAEAFFSSRYFFQLTGISDGLPVLEKLKQEYNRKRKGRNKLDFERIPATRPAYESY